ncbi:MAG: hypothetical protein BEN19_06950 [Epulopiscium sp. Nuni2H_MBin003]|nr:MAG: hypothetical protein BEN19_06950 [Epulopiscium sp. Nuni2H_MBin003]
MSLKNKKNALEAEITKYEDGLYVDLVDGKGHFQAFSNLPIDQYKNGKFILVYFGATKKVNIVNSEDRPNPKAVNFDEVPRSIDQELDQKFMEYLLYLKTQQAFLGVEGDLNEVANIQSWFNRFDSALQELFEQPGLKLKFNRKELAFYIEEPNREPYQFNELSAGYSAVLDIIINLIMRMEKTDTTAYDVEGIVLIDEIETHLHIQLQKKILPFLTSFFPKLQFIVTTHSPFILSSIPNAVIYDLEKQEHVENLSGVSYSGIVEEYFEVGEYSQVIQIKLDRYEYLLNHEPDNEEEIIAISEELSKLDMSKSPEVVLRFNILEMDRKSRG